MANPQRPAPWRPEATFVASNAEVTPGRFAEVAWASLTENRRLVLIAETLDRESYAADPGDRQADLVALRALLPPEDLRLLERLWAERPDLATRRPSEIDREEAVHRAYALLEAMARGSFGPTEADDGDQLAD